MLVIIIMLAVAYTIADAIDYVRKKIWSVMP